VFLIVFCYNIVVNKIYYSTCSCFEASRSAGFVGQEKDGTQKQRLENAGPAKDSRPFRSGENWSTEKMTDLSTSKFANNGLFITTYVKRTWNTAIQTSKLKFIETR